MCQYIRLLVALCTFQEGYVLLFSHLLSNNESWYATNQRRTETLSILTIRVFGLQCRWSTYQYMTIYLSFFNICWSNLYSIRTCFIFLSRISKLSNILVRNQPENLKLFLISTSSLFICVLYIVNKC
ncbi:hypothetical protein FR483_N462R [Paramecium bursaria Chlorella virus FR483]|uniref:Uncharacterized protein N462R n=1 Tax=Paramecium bursaria Chlorella virus FR483 TaxID=399781 RepID=A7J7G6_PBCVF|nr:hypothetical protein FR483_N462R [Paramecium bursaria Chlorella virus FR483]ABT15747.1 hypothetical protein FR483_N462R [Paramecium bursaria Chlorella virus FR483]